MTTQSNTSGTAIVLGVLAGVTIGGVLAYAFLTRKQLEALRAEAGALLPTGIRLPRPDVWVHLPNSVEDYNRLDETVCDCLNSLPDIEADELVQSARLCAARDLVPDFPWPPVSHDHESVQTLWAVLGFLAGRAVTMHVCPTPVPASPVQPPPPRMPNPGAAYGMHRSNRPALRMYAR